MTTHGSWRRLSSSRLGRCHTPWIAVLGIGTGRSIGGGGGLQNRGLLGIWRVMGNTPSRGSLRGIWLSSRRQMRGMDIHVRRGVIHAAAECGGSRIVAVTGVGQRVIGGGSQIGRRRSRLVVGRTGQTGTRAGSIGGRHGRVRIVRAIRLGGWQAEGREFVTGQQGPFGGVVVVPRDFSRTSGMDLRDRWELQLFGWTRTAREESWALDEWMCPTRDGKSSGKATGKRYKTRAQCNAIVESRKARLRQG